MARTSEYDFLKEYKGKSVIYALYTDAEGIRYIGHSTNVRERFKNHIRNHSSEKNIRKWNWIEKHKLEIKIRILSESHDCWEAEEKKLIAFYGSQLLNICEGGKNNRIQKPFSSLSDEEHLYEINKSLRDLMKYYKSKGKEREFRLFSKTDISNICNGIFRRKENRML